MATYFYDSLQSASERLVASFDYEPRNTGELSIKAGEEVQVRQQEGQWVKAERNGVIGYLPRAYLAKPDSLEAMPWYFPEVTRAEATELLYQARPGTYLVRPSSEDKRYALSIKTATPHSPVCHYQILYNEHKGFYITPNLSDFSVRRLLSFYQNDQENRICLKHRLLYPCPKSTPRIYQISPKNEPIDPDEIIIKEKAGEGHFGVVMLGYYKHFKIAVKSFKKENNNNLWEKEIAPLLVLHHPNVVTCYGFCARRRWIIFECVDYCLLGQLQAQVYTDNQLYAIATQIARGMVYVHSMKFIHRDLAARNILITIHKQVKISDFGLSRKLSSLGAYSTDSSETPIQWEALESLTDQVYKKSTDVWMFGVLLYELYTNGKTPHSKFTGMKRELIQHLKQGNRLSCPERMPSDVRKLQEQCMLKSPKKRPNFKKILSTFQ